MSAPPLEATLAILSAHGHDFREYQSETLLRRYADHVARLAIEPACWLAQLRDDPDERTRLVDALLVSATAFFRHVELFHVLRDHVLPAMARAAPQGLRVWVAGVATGEEAWSIAMLLAELEAQGGPRWEVIGSDLSPSPLAIARVGRYPRAAAAGIPADLRAEYTERSGDDIAIVDGLRAGVRFAQHDLLGPSLAPPEAVLARFDLVMCCNVLIYLERRLQLRVLDRLLSVLAPDGTLALGADERPPPELAHRLRRYPDLAQQVPLFRPGASA